MRATPTVNIPCALLATAVVVASPPPAWAQVQESPEARIDALFENFARPGSPGAAIGVIRSGEIVYSQGYGLANLELDVPITPKSVFYLGSVSKQFVATAIALLEQEGKLSFEDDIRDHMPEMPDYGVPITISHLIHHTSGIRDYLGLMNLAGLPLGTFHSNEGVVELIARQKALNFAPGDRYLYSNSGYLLLAEVVYRASGKSLREFAQERIFEPLGMQNTHFHDDYTHLIPGRASAYFAAARGRYTAFLTTFDRVGSGGVFSTVEDLLEWDRNFYDHRVGGPELQETLHTQGVLNSGQEISYAFGLEVGEYRGMRRVEHGGALGGYRSDLLRFPDEEFSVIILANIPTVSVGSLAQQIADIYLEERFAAAEAEAAAEAGEQGTPSAQATAQDPGADAGAGAGELVEVPPAELDRVAGYYWNPGESYSRHIIPRDGRLFYHRSLGNENRLGPLGDGRFLMLGVPGRVEVVFEPAVGTPTMMRVLIDDEPPVEMGAYEPWKPSPEQLEPYAGVYYSEELDAEYTVEVVRNALHVFLPAGERFPFVPVMRDTFQFAARGVVIDFTGDRDPSDSAPAAGFLLQAGRVRNLSFVRR